ncbi:MAG: cytochrome c family protein [Planctomycetes bacterium]|nr:cytochrome c family protein [Planctomycetota bacterium]
MPNRYIGSATCKNCHQAVDAGDQFGHWQKSKHSQAFEVLASAEAKAYAKERGIENPQTDAKCLKCHETAFGAPKEDLHRSFKTGLGVQCETCHGPGELHRKARMAAAGAAGEGGGKYTAIPDDEVIKSPAPALCVECHNEDSPGYKPFCFHESRGEIRHLNPLKPRTDEERAALDSCNCAATCKCLKDAKDGKCTIPPKAPAAAGGGDEKKDEKK